MRKEKHLERRRKEMEIAEGNSLALTPTWAVATVITFMVSLGFFFQGSLKRFGKWLDKTKRKALVSSLDKIKEELMLFGLLSLLMGHWIVFVARICVKSSAMTSRFYPCPVKSFSRQGDPILVSTSNHPNNSFSGGEAFAHKPRSYCPEGKESFASYESLEQLHRLIFVLATTHVSYSFFTVVLAILKIHSWRVWENYAKKLAFQSLEQDSPDAGFHNARLRRLSTFIFHHTSHPWSQHRVLVWLLCFSRQFWSSISRADYMALRLGFVTKHQLSLTYDFHNYMLRSMDEEFRDIVGISVPLWIYAICCIFLDFHGTDIYFWLSFLPAILILLIGTKLHRVVVKLAVEIMDTSSSSSLGDHQFNLRDDLFWFGKPQLLLWLIQLVSFQNAFEMATFLWSLWEIKDSSCFMENRLHVAIRLTFGVATQFWCSFITFPLYIIITQMGTRFKKTVVTENVMRSLHGWKKRVKARRDATGISPLLAVRSTTSLDSLIDRSSSSMEGRGIEEDALEVQQEASTSHTSQVETSEISQENEIIEAPFTPVVPFAATSSEEDIDDYDENEQVDNDQNLEVIDDIFSSR